MSKHVDNLMAAYIEGGLPPARASQVYTHLSGCLRCRVRLSRFEQIGLRLTNTLRSEPVASPTEVREWWAVISSGAPAHMQRREYQVLASLALTLVLVLVPTVAALARTGPTLLTREGTREQSGGIMLTDVGGVEIVVGQYPAHPSTTALVSIQATLSPPATVAPAPVPFSPTGQ